MRRRARARSVAVVMVLGWAIPASGYVRQRTEGGAEWQWQDACIGLTGYVGDFAQMPPEDVEGAMKGAAGVWSRESNACTHLSLNVSLGAGPAPRAVPEDRRNIIIFRTETWCALDDRGECIPEDHNYAIEALALTSTSVGTTTGIIRDVDIEVNAVTMAWADLVAHPELATGVIFDLQNALTHEIGHLIGLGHTCFEPSEQSPVPPSDHRGQPVIVCAPDNPAEITETTMYPSALPRETQKRTLAPDDHLAVCELFPVSADPGRCGAPDDGSGCGCAAVGTEERDPGPILAALLVVGALARPRGRRHRRRQTCRSRA